MRQTLISMAAAALFAVAGNASAADQPPLKIGFITDMSGLYADIDGQQKQSQSFCPIQCHQNRQPPF